MSQMTMPPYQFTQPQARTLQELARKSRMSVEDLMTLGVELLRCNVAWRKDDEAPLPVAPDGVAVATTNEELDRTIDVALYHGRELESGFVERLSDGFGYPSGGLFWSMYFSDLTDAARAFGLQTLIADREFEAHPSWNCDAEVFKKLLEIRDNPPRRAGTQHRSRAWQRDRQAALIGCHFADAECGTAESRDYTCFSFACTQIGMSFETAKRLADPDALRPLLPQYIDLLVKTNNAVHAQWIGKTRGETTAKEVALMRAHTFSDAALEKIAASPIAALFLARRDTAYSTPTPRRGRPPGTTTPLTRRTPNE